MSKWYRPSISLAAKCRVGFAAAVLLIIVAALFVPYRWMDKLVEQGKMEVAQAEVQHVLERHFIGLDDSAGVVRGPVLRFVDPAGTLLIDPDRKRPVDVPGAVNESGPYRVRSDAAALGDILRTEWVPLYGPDRPELTDLFVLRGVHRFKNEKDRVEYFKPLAEGLTASQADDEESFGQDVIKQLGMTRPWRYLRAVRTEHGCLVSGCHAETSGRENPASPAPGPSVFTEGELVGVISVVLPAGQLGTTLLFNRIFIVVGGLFAIICAVVTFYLITQRFILQPVRRLREAADHMMLPSPEPPETAADDLPAWQEVMDMTRKIKTGDEFERLGVAFHHMLERLKLAHDRLRESNLALDTRVGELQEKNVALFESNKLKSEFLANVSHELRTPLNAVIGFAEILKDQADSRNDTKSGRYAANVMESGKLLLTIINDLLDLARIEAGKMEVHWAKCSISEIVEALVNFTRPLAEQKELEVATLIDTKIALIESDPGKLQQILFNLLSNAIKFTPRRGKIVVVGRMADSEHLELEVADTGPGIAQADQEKIFEKFYQLEASVTKEHSGTGLGLAIVKELVEMLGGAISLRSQDGMGSVFVVRLPVKHRLPEPETPVPQGQVI